MGKFDLLEEYLKTRSEKTVTLTFGEIENIIGEKLSNSATGYPQYWYDKSRSFAKAWKNNDRKAVKFVINQSVSFEKTNTKYQPKPRSRNLDKTQTKPMLSNSLIEEIMITLSKNRPIFHSEADFQHQLAWELQKKYPESKIRLEYPYQLDKKIYLDIFATIENSTYVIELKYKTRSLNTRHNGESFSLKDQSAQDIGRYDFLKDVERLENVCHENDQKGFAIILTNDSAYWKEPNRKTIDAAFRIQNGKTLNGMLAWDSTAGAGTTKNREAPIYLGSEYHPLWVHYSEVGTETYSVFNYLCLEIK